MRGITSFNRLKQHQQNKGDILFFQSPTPLRIAQHGREALIAVITACIMVVCVTRKHHTLFSPFL